MPALNPQRAEFYLEHSKVHLSPALPTPSNDLLGADVGGFLVVSPYTCPPHLLDLKPLSDSQRLLARALTVLQPSREDYATASYTEAFNWDAVIGELRALVVSSSYKWKRQRFYIVVFRSQVPATTNRLQLGELDQTSHAEATKSGGLLKYCTYFSKSFFPFRCCCLSRKTCFGSLCSAKTSQTCRKSQDLTLEQ